MIRESVRLGCGCFVLLGMLLYCQSAAAQVSPLDSDPPLPLSAANNDLEAQIISAVRNSASMASADVIQSLQDLLRGDLSEVSDSVRAGAYHALATAYEKSALQARADKLNPAAERDSERFIDAAVEAYIKSGEAGLAIGDHNFASSAFGKALGYRPANEQALLGLARVYAASGRALQAIEKYQDYFRASKRGLLGAHDPSLYVEIGRVYLAANLWNQAIKSFRDAIRNGGDNDEVASLLAEAYMGLNRLDEALSQIRKAIDMNPGQPLYYSRHAQILLMNRAIDQATQEGAKGVETARARLRAQPDDLKAMEILGHTYDVYTRVLSTILAGDPGQTKARLALVNCLQQQSELAQLLTLHRALSIIKNAPETDRDNIELLERQILLERTVRHRNLKQTSERLLRIDPENKIAKEALGRVDSETTDNK